MSGLPRMGRRALLVATVTAVAAAVTLGAANPANAAPIGEIIGEAAPGAIEGRYLVVLKSDVVGAAGTARAKENVRGKAIGLAGR
jgi:hypothetical protein